MYVCAETNETKKLMMTFLTFEIKFYGSIDRVLDVEAVKVANYAFVLRSISLCCCSVGRRRKKATYDVTAYDVTAGGRRSRRVQACHQSDVIGHRP